MTERTEDEKRLIYRSWHRGTREMDILLGRFADAYVPGLSPKGLAEYDALLTIEDPDLWDYYTAKTCVPENQNTQTLQAFLKFKVV